MSPWRILIAVACLWSGLTMPAAAADRPRPSPQELFAAVLADARRLAAEKSWALAQERFAFAGRIAPDVNARRWCDLGLADATWRNEDSMGMFRGDQPERRDARNRAFNTLLAPYEQGTSRDVFWLAIMRSRADFRDTLREFPASWADQLDILQYLADEPPSPASANALIEFLQALPERISPEHLPPTVRDRFAGFFALAVRVAPPGEDRGWALLQWARLGAADPQLALSVRADRWAQALAGTVGTAWRTEAVVEEYLFRIRTGWSPGQPIDAPAEVKSRLDELETFRAQLRTLDSTRVPPTLAATLDGYEKAWRRSWLGLAMESQFTTNTAPRFRYIAAGFRQLTVEVYRHTLDSWLARPDGIGEMTRAGITPDNRFTADHVKALRAQAERVNVFTIPLEGAENRVWQSAVRELPVQAPGFYTVLLQGEGPGGEEAYLQHFLVSDLRMSAVTAIGAPGTAFFYDAQTHRPAAGIEVRGSLREDDKPRQAFNGTLDASGAISLPAIGAADASNVSGHLTVLAGDQPIDEDLFASGRNLPPLTVDLILDRPIYRPGETVHWKLIARERRDGRFTPVTKKLLLVVRLRSSGTPLASPQPLDFNAFGTAHGEWAIPASANPDDVDAWLSFADNADEPLGMGRSFRIDNIVPPALTASLAVTSDPSSMTPGHAATVRLQVAYFSGGAAAGIPVSCRFTTTHYAVNPVRDDMGEIAFAAWKETLDKETQKVVTDHDGRAEFSVRIPEGLPDDVSLSAAATLLPEGGTAVVVSERMQITATGLVVKGGSSPNLRAARPGEVVTFTREVRDGADRPQQLEGEAELVEQAWLESWLNPDGVLVSGADLIAARRALKLPPGNPLPSPWRKLYGGYSQTPVASTPFQSAADGTVRVRFPIPHAGLFQLRLSREKTVIAPADNLDVVAADETTTTLALRPDLAELLIPGPVESGRPLSMLVVAPEGQPSGLVAVSGEREVVTRRFDLAGRAGWITLERPPAFFGAGQAALQTFDVRGRRIAASEHFPVSNPAVRLNVSVQPGSEESRPGAAGIARIKVTELSGRPASAEIMAFANDEAVNRLWRAAPSAVPSFWNESAVLISSLQGGLRDFDPMEKLEPLSDLRPGMVLNRSTPDRLDEEFVELSPFEVSSGGGIGYFASNTIAGSRLARDIGGLPGAWDGADPVRPEIVIRRHFSSTAFWEPEIVTDDKGEAEIGFTYPDNLTQWRFTAYAVGRDGETFGKAGAFSHTSLPFQARLQSPRFLVTGDSATFSADLVSRTDQTLTASARFTAQGAIQTKPGESPDHDRLSVPAQEQAHTSWKVQAVSSGAAKLDLAATAGAEADAMQLTVPVLENGLLQETAAAGRIPGDKQTVTLNLPLPDPLDSAHTQVSIEISPSHAAVLLDALPGLIDYPYGCVEQTMSRFLPAIVVQKALLDLGFEAAAVEHRIMHIPPAIRGAPRAAGVGLSHLDEVVAQSLARLGSARIGPGSYGWWPGQRVSDPWMTAYVGWGLALARQAGIEVPEPLFPLQAVISNCTSLPRTDGQLAWNLAALAQMFPSVPAAESAIMMAQARRNFTAAFATRDQLSASGRASLASAAAVFGTAEQRTVLLRNLENGAQRVRNAEDGDTVHWGREQDYWQAMDGAVESTALSVLALLDNDPHHPLVEPAVNWLVLNRRSAGWQNTRQTALAVLALTRALVARGEVAPEGVVELRVNGRAGTNLALSREALLAGTLEFPVDPSQLRPGLNRLELRRTSGKVPVYAVALASSWAKGETVKPDGHLIGVSRSFDRMREQPTLAGTLRVERESLEPGGTVVAGESVAACVTLTVPNELEYLMVEAPRPAGCEPLNALSGWDAQLQQVNGPAPAAASARPNTNSGARARSVYREEHDTQSVFFLDHLPAGTWEIRYRVRATTPGDFQTLPVKVEAMYAPDIRANSDARRLRIESVQR